MEPQARIKLLCDQGNSVIVDGTVPLRRYQRSGMEMTKMAKVYEEERNYESAFILYMRYITLFVEKLREHPEYKCQTAAEKSKASKDIKANLVAAERLKTILKEQFHKEYNKIIEQQKVIEEELKREHEKNMALAAKAKELNKTNDSYKNVMITPLEQEIQEDSRIREVNYPTESLTFREGPEYENSEISPVSQPQNYSLPLIPSRDSKPTPTDSFSATVPLIDRGNKPTSLMSAHSDHKSGGLRKVLIPHLLMTKFLSLATSNTLKNVETCGFLAGKMMRDVFTITHILIPQQVGFPDSCDTLHEEELYEHQDKHGLLTLGWIHTHPTQTAFLSSVDLHTHCSYQLMMPEAIAIVCAPKFNETGFFNLTPNYGMNFIANCRQTGFHPHPNEPPLFQTAEHIILDDSLTIDVIDLRR